MASQLTLNGKTKPWMPCRTCRCWLRGGHTALTGTKYGAVLRSAEPVPLFDGAPVRSCVIPVGIEGRTSPHRRLATQSRNRCSARGSKATYHNAVIASPANHVCHALLAQKARPTDETSILQ